MSQMVVRLGLSCVGGFALALLLAPFLEAQAPPRVERASDESGFTITCEVFCSDTKLRTANARIRWHATTPGPESARLASANQSLQVTVFADGFDKELYVTVPTGRESRGQRAAPAPGLAREPRPLRAFQFRVLESPQFGTSERGTPEQSIVLEDLEPGVNYSWRVLAETPAGRVASPVVMCEVPVCPADMVREPRRPGVGEPR